MKKLEREFVISVSETESVKVHAEFIGFERKWDVMKRRWSVTVTNNRDKSETFDFWCGWQPKEYSCNQTRHQYNEQENIPSQGLVNETDFACFMYNIFDDAIFGSYTLDEFQSELCYEKPSELIEAYMGCQKVRNQLSRLGFYEDLYKYEEFVQEKYGC